MFDSNTHLLLTGGTGFFGLALLRHWQAMDGEVPRITILSRNPERFAIQYPNLANLVEWARGDVLTPSSLPQGQHYSHIIHGATDSTHGLKLSPLERYIQIVEGTRNILEFAIASRTTRFLLTSSGGVYGSQPQDMEQIPENYKGMPDPLNPQHAYSIGKRCAEHLCALYQAQYGLETVIGRCFTFAGRDLPLGAHFAIGNFIRDALVRSEILVTGDGTPIRSYMDQRDLAHWLTTLLFNGHAGQAYNIGSDLPITIAELAYKVRDLIAPNKPVRIANTITTHSFRNRYIPSITKAQKTHGLNLVYTLDETILATAFANDF